ncbi:nitroreductase family deazaflavin-dependent oxidoreductase [Nocardia transvalensis]|uniref:nitroreductase family deazaflavin-dependent oxidoreductase n=1 Tax=Nocardia transvalensis TaxID=37333 RepID=UPI0018953C18|nr:nitroreductase family deazaflavin-dependent oxidoreductase [Nocardia transvalensis]MBF6327662.1 nitroreductase family deazaflavin-dependent oxidoreductase [Nocardia transvalensis]
MFAKNHPNNAPGVPMVFPPVVERWQIKHMNPAILRLSYHLPWFAIVKNRGRKSGRDYETIVNYYRKGNTLAILLAHGKTNWVKNVLAAGEADVHLFRKDVHIVNPRVLPAGTRDPTLPLIPRLAVRRLGVLVADIV